MTMPSDITVVETGTDDTGSYVDWPAIIAGIALAAGISLVLIAFGSAIGLGFADFRAREGVSPIWIAIAAATWLLWVQVSSFMAGGYLTGRLRRRRFDASEHEVEVRDGAHGLLVWAGALVIGGLIAAGGVGAAANAVGSAVATLTTAASNVADDASAGGPNAYYVDRLFRPEPQAAATPALAGRATANDGDAARGEATRIFAQAATDELADDDRTYLAQLVARQTGMTEEQATARVDEVVSAIEAAKAEAVEAAEAARKTGVLAAFLTAAAFLVSAAGAFWAAQKGGDHRDRGTAFPAVFRRT